MNNQRIPIFTTFALSAVCMLAGCSGSPGSQLPSGTSPVQVQGNAVPILEMSKKCSASHGVSVHPCSVKLSLKSPTATVTTKGPKSGSFTVSDTKCTDNGVATVSGSGNTYLVTAGANKGTCTAKFMDKKANGERIGTAKLSITNNPT